jgi:NAD(P)-dependent dehydrogenase (short-subunit alcohol dehydrogenase family)
VREGTPHPDNPVDAASSRQVAVVTGGSRGVGRGIAEVLASQGAAVCIMARTASEVEAAADDIGALGLGLDVTEPQAVKDAFHLIEAELGPVTLLVNNAGALHAIGPLWEADPETWWRDSESHLRGAFLCTHAALPRMVERGSGRVVNVVGMLGQMGDGHSTSHACAKAAMFRMTDCLAHELEGSGAHVFCVSPGPVRTAITERLAESAEGRRWLPDFAEIGESEWLSPEECGELVARIATGELDRLSGRYLYVGLDLDEAAAQADAIRADDRLVLRLVR